MTGRRSEEGPGKIPTITRITGASTSGIGHLLMLGILFGLLTGFADLLISFSTAPSGLAELPITALTVISAATAVLLAYLAVWFSAGILAQRLFKLSSAPLAAAVGSFLSQYILLVKYIGLPIAPWRAGDGNLLVLAFCLLSSTAIYLAGSHGGTTGVAANRSLLLTAGPTYFLLLTALFVWWDTYRSPGEVSWGAWAVYSALLLMILRVMATRGSLVPLAVHLILVGALLFAAGLSGFFAGTNPANPARTPAPIPFQADRVLLITIDSLRADAVSAYNRREPKTTPHIDALAADSVLFARAFAPAPWTLPSLTSLMTGFSPFVHGVRTYRSRLPDSLPTLADYLRSSGYATAAVGFNPFFDPRYGLDKGIDESKLVPRYSMSRSLGSQVLARFARRFRQTVDTEEITATVLDWLDRNQARNFFLWVHYYDPHLPYTPPPGFAPPREMAPAIGPRFERPEDAHREGRTLDSREQRWVRSLYEAEVMYVDSAVGRIMEQLKERDLYDGSLIVLTSDHGEEFWEHGGLAHGRTLYNEALQVPLLIKEPGTNRGRVVEGSVSLESVMPTILELTGVAQESEALVAPSLVSAWRAEESQMKAYPILSTGASQYEDRVSVIFDEFKYIRSVASGREELYNLERDPGELQNILHLEKEARDRARALLRDHLERADGVRRHYGIREPAEFSLDQERIEVLKSLGYIR